MLQVRGRQGRRRPLREAPCVFHAGQRVQRPCLRSGLSVLARVRALEGTVWFVSTEHPATLAFARCVALLTAP